MSSSSPDETASTTRIGVELGPFRGELRQTRRRRVEDEEPRLVLGYVDRALEADGRASRASAPRRPSVPDARGRRALPALAPGEVRLDEVARHAARRYGGGRGGNVRTSELCSARVAAAAQLGARAHAELGVDVRQVACDRPLAEEQRGGDLAVRPALRDELGDAPLGRRQALARASARRSGRARRAPARPSVAAPSSSKPSRAASIASRAARFCRARRRTTPSASSARALPERVADRLVLLDRAAPAGASASSSSPRAAATSPRQRVTSASTQLAPRRGPRPPPRRSSRRIASSIRPSSSSASA